MSARDIDITIYGATGFTGSLVAEYLAGMNDPDLRLAFGGRNGDKLRAVAEANDCVDRVTLIEADATDRPALDKLAARSKVVIAMAGPYAQYGSQLVGACVEAGTDYVDLCGEPQWMREMIEKHQARAEETGARIVFSCGFDSIPSDLGVVHLQTLAQEKFGGAFPRVKGRVERIQGGPSGGTVASLIGSTKAAAADPAVRDVMISPFGLTPGFQGPKQPHGQAPVEDEDLGTWAAPFVMAVINVKNVHRTNVLAGLPWGEGFVYDEMMVTGPGEKGAQMAKQIASMGPGGGMGESKLKPGDGPSKEERENGFFTIALHGSGLDGHTGVVRVSGDKDPGYGCTSMMISQAALCLLRDGTEARGGIWTPGAAMGETVVKRLSDAGVLTFEAKV
ncbi:trans-acting enoyl reductase family protein [Marimonas sp. MJW-29]|uniref:Trans-acting enoyl reductase family protein n=1 Tax=Sulfitobacter sediminis TaxID=3234186 RepID=A0ABV3RIJ2_9RHOB